MSRPGIPLPLDSSLTVAQQRANRSAEQILGVCRALGLSISQTVHTLNVAISFARTEQDEQRANRGNQKLGEGQGHGQ